MWLISLLPVIIINVLDRTAFLSLYSPGTFHTPDPQCLVLDNSNINDTVAILLDHDCTSPALFNTRFIWSVYTLD